MAAKAVKVGERRRRGFPRASRIGGQMSVINKEYDVLVVGAGVAGIHAAHAAAEHHATVLLLTSSWDTVGVLAWGSSWSGDNKEKEKTLPGFPGKALTNSAIYAGPRANGHVILVDSFKYQGLWKYRLEKRAEITIFQDTCEALERAKRGWIAQTAWGAEFRARTAILAIGPFLGQEKDRDSSRSVEGRSGEAGAERLRESIAVLKIETRPDECRAAPTVAAHSINWGRVRKGDTGKTADPVGATCWTEAANGARIELEPTSIVGDEIYLRGWEGVTETHAFKESRTALEAMVGLEKAHITRPAHGVSYVTIRPELLLETIDPEMQPKASPAAHPEPWAALPKLERSSRFSAGYPDGLRGLFFAGRFSGAKSYKESAEQGLRAGVAAAFLKFHVKHEQ